MIKFSRLFALVFIVDFVFGVGILWMTLADKSAAAFDRAWVALHWPSSQFINPLAFRWAAVDSGPMAQYRPVAWLIFRCALMALQTATLTCLVLSVIRRFHR